MKRKNEVSPTTITGTNLDEPVFERTQRWLETQLDSGNWNSVPPVVTLETGQNEIVVDGNQRRDFAQKRGLSIPSVITIETDKDIQELREHGALSGVYSKVSKVGQLRSLLENRSK